jgi:hypothetical protein
MLGKMIIQGLIAAAIIGAAATVYAQSQNQTNFSGTDSGSLATSAITPAAQSGGTGYLQPTGADNGRRDQGSSNGYREGRHDGQRESHREGHHRKDHDRDDD